MSPCLPACSLFLGRRRPRSAIAAGPAAEDAVISLALAALLMVFAPRDSQAALGEVLSQCVEAFATSSAGFGWRGRTRSDGVACDCLAMVAEVVLIAASW